MYMERFFSEIEEQLEGAREKDRCRYRIFFANLQPALKASRILENERNRHFAHRFNIFNYLCTDELGLSRIIADLLDSRASHGQGAAFFRTLLERLVESIGWASGIEVEERSLSVCTELKTTGNRRIDIAVRFKDTRRNNHCIAIENKPYADDQDDQIRDYLEFLNREYEGRFVLMYSPPSSQGPSAKSIVKFELDNKWTKHFRILPYCQAVEDPRDGFDNYRIRDYSLEDWFADCRRNCDVDRLRWFLKDAESFCRKKFGGHAMPTDTETRTIQEYVLSHADNVATAKAVHEAWPAIKERIHKRFLKNLQARIYREVQENSPEFPPDITIDCDCPSGRNKDGILRLYRRAWAPVEENHPSKLRRTSVLLYFVGKECDTWLGVESPHWVEQNEDAAEEPRFRMDVSLVDKLGTAKKENYYPWWKAASEEFRQWGDFLPEFHRECEDNQGEITDYFVDTFMEITVAAIPIIDRMEDGVP